MLFRRHALSPARSYGHPSGRRIGDPIFFAGAAATVVVALSGECA